MSVIAIFQQLQALSQVILDRARPASYLRYGDVTTITQQWLISARLLMLLLMSP
jgi:hypothetical protein